MMTTRGHLDIRRGTLGNVADEVIRSSSVPVSVLSLTAIDKDSESDYQPSTLTIPLAWSSLAKSILPFAHHLAKQLSIGIHLLRVGSLRSLAYYAGEGVAVDIPPVEEELQEETTAYLYSVTHRLTAQAAAPAASTVMTSFPALTTNGHLRETSQNLVAICTHGCSGVGRFMMGSVADTIIRSTKVPLLVYAAHTEE